MSNLWIPQELDECQTDDLHDCALCSDYELCARREKLEQEQTQTAYENQGFMDWYRRENGWPPKY